MNSKNAQELSLNELKTEYKKYLMQQNLSPNTIQTALNDTFYLWKNDGPELFWTSVLSSNFEAEYRSVILNVLKAHSKGNPENGVNHYVSCARRFRRFLELESENSNHSKKAVQIKSNRKLRMPLPCKEEVDRYLNQWNELENYHLQENALDKLFFELCPENRDISDVLLKVSTLNDFYSTNIFSVYPVAKHILSLDIDKRIRAGDITLVGDLQRVMINGIEKNFYSFSTKYCSHHNPIEFPIYDSYVEKVLKYFRDEDRFTNFENNDLKNYIMFKSILGDFRSYYELQEYDLKQIDRYLWQLGKEYFPKNYKKKKDR